MPHILSIIYPEENRQTVQIPENGLLIGSSADCSLQLNDEYTSDKNSRVYFENGNIFIEDLNSTNGTKVEGSRVKKHALKPEESIEIGAIVMKYSYTDS